MKKWNFYQLKGSTTYQAGAFPSYLFTYFEIGIKEETLIEKMKRYPDERHKQTK